MNYKNYFIIVLVLVLFSCVYPVYAREGGESQLYRWRIYTGGAVYHVSDDNNSHFGPELELQYAFTNHWGVYATTVYPAVQISNRGYEFGEGLASDFGCWFSPRPVRPWLTIGVGFSHIFGSDSDGSYLDAGGFHISSRATHWFTGHFGVWARGALRFWFSEVQRDSRFSPSFSAGIGFRF